MLKIDCENVFILKKNSTIILEKSCGFIIFLEWNEISTL